MPKTLRLILPLLLLALPTAAQEDFCGVCKNEGYVPCEDKKCRKVVCPTTIDHLCTRRLRLPCCHGLGKVPCKFCDHNHAKFAFGIEMDGRKKWLEDMKALETRFRIKKMEHIQTDHFNLHYDIPKIKVGMKTYDMFKGAHLYAERLEDLYAEWTKRFDRPYRSPTTGRWDVYMVRDLKERDRVTQTIIGGNATKLFGTTTSIYVVAAGKRVIRKHAQRPANVNHHVSHLITQQGHPIGKFEYPGWWSAGIAHWLEENEFGDTRNFCTGEVSSRRDKWQDGGWKGKMFSRVSRKKDISLATFAKRDVDKLSPMLQAYSWSFVDFILTEHADAAAGLERDLTSSGNTEAAFRKNLGMTVARFQDAWREWVLKAYAR